MGRAKKMAKRLANGAALFACLALFVIGARFALYRSLQRRISSDPRFRICQLIEIPEEPISLRAGTIEELLGLKGGDHNLFAFDVARAQCALLAHPLIESARLWRSPPCAITVHYRVRRPFAELTEWPELLLDKSGHLFPYRPHFTPKQLPRLTLGLPDQLHGANCPLSCQRGGRLAGARAELGLEILNFLNALLADENTRVASLDVSAAFDEDLGRRGVSLTLEDQLFFDGKSLVCRRTLRLSADKWRAQLNRYRLLLLSLGAEELRAVGGIEPDQLARSPKRVVESIDLRLPQLAYLKLRIEECDRAD